VWDSRYLHGYYKRFLPLWFTFPASTAGSPWIKTDLAPNYLSLVFHLISALKKQQQRLSAKYFGSTSGTSFTKNRQTSLCQEDPTVLCSGLNELPADIRMAESLTSFRKRLKTVPLLTPARPLLSLLLRRQLSNYETRSIHLATMNAWNLFYSFLYVPQRHILLSPSKKFTLCKSLWMTATAKCPKCKCTVNLIFFVMEYW